MKALKNLSVQKVVFIFYFFTIFNILIHVLDAKFIFIGLIIEGLLLVTKLVVCTLLYRVLKDSDSYIAPYAGYIKAIIICDVIQAFLGIMMGSGTFAALLYLGMIIIKSILDFLFYLRVNRIEEYNTIWKVINVVCVAVVFCLLFRKTWILYIVVIAYAVRYILAFAFIRSIEMGEDEDSQEADEDSNVHKAVSVKKSIIKKVLESEKAKLLSERLSTKKAKRIYLVLFCFFMLAFMWLRFSKVPYRDEEKFYVMTNRMPEWSGFKDYWCGVIDKDTGEKHKNLYHCDRLIFDSTGIAYDHQGHFIDRNDNVVVKVPYFILGKKPYIPLLFEAICGVNEYNHDEYYMGAFHDEDYFVNRKAMFYCAPFDTYGVINDKGQIIAWPGYDKNHIKRYEVLVLIDSNNKTLTIYDNDGQSIRKYDGFNYFPGCWEDHDEKSVIAFSIEDGESYTSYLANYSGQEIYSSEGSFSCHEKGDRLVVFFKNAIVILNSDGEMVYEQKTDNDVVDYKAMDGLRSNVILELSKESEKCRFFDVNTLGYVGKEYSTYIFGEYSRVFLGVRYDNRCIDIITSDDGQLNITETNYTFVRKIDHTEKFKVSRQNENGEIEYNILRSDGTLENEEWTTENF